MDNYKTVKPIHIVLLLKPSVFRHPMALLSIQLVYFLDVLDKNFTLTQRVSLSTPLLLICRLDV
jgi:hypothetical protein